MLINLSFSGCKDKTIGTILRDIIQTSYFRVVVVEDADSVECCGALKVITFSNIITNKSVRFSLERGHIFVALYFSVTRARKPQKSNFIWNYHTFSFLNYKQEKQFLNILPKFNHCNQHVFHVLNFYILITETESKLQKIQF